MTATPDEVIDGTAYFYNLPITVQNGHIYTLPMTGGDDFPFTPLAIFMILFGYTIAVVIVKPKWFRRFCRTLKHN